MRAGIFKRISRLQFGVGTLFAVTALAALGFWSLRPFVIEEHWEDGSPKARYEVRRAWTGELLVDGRATRWYGNVRCDAEVQAAPLNTLSFASVDWTYQDLSIGRELSVSEKEAVQLAHGLLRVVEESMVNGQLGKAQALLQLTREGVTCTPDLPRSRQLLLEDVERVQRRLNRLQSK